MNEKVNEDIFSQVAAQIKAEQRIVTYQLAVICAAIALYAIVTVIGFFVLRAHPSISCTFINNELLLWFWPPNSAILDTIEASEYSQADQCLFIATRSLASMAMLPTVVVFFVKQLFASDRYHIQGMMTVFIAMLLVSFFTAYIGPTEHVSRYQMSFKSAIEVNVWKSMIHIFAFYLAAFVLTFRIPAYIRSIRSIQ